MKYYKITNEEEIHNGMQYKTGLNTDIRPFNPSGDCQEGGLYFTSEDILAFLDYGCWIREVRIPKGEEVYLNPYNPVKWKSHRIILGKRRKITSGVVIKLIEEGACINSHAYYPLVNFVLRGKYLKLLKYIHKKTGISTNFFNKLFNGLGNSDIPIIGYKFLKFLCDYIEPDKVHTSSIYYYILKILDIKDFSKIVRYMIKKKIINKKDDFLLRNILCDENIKDIIKILNVINIKMEDISNLYNHSCAIEYNLLHLFLIENKNQPITINYISKYFGFSKYNNNIKKNLDRLLSDRSIDVSIIKKGRITYYVYLGEKK